MALIFRWYFMHTMHLALQGDPQYKLNYQIYGTSSMGAFNQWVKGTLLEEWQNRHVDVIANKLMQETASIFTQYYSA
jgi:trans-AT polyketide synthase/acyltransferase/oxidoreductase domain-containing protein